MTTVSFQAETREELDNLIAEYIGAGSATSVPTPKIGRNTKTDAAPSEDEPVQTDKKTKKPTAKKVTTETVQLKCQDIVANADDKKAAKAEIKTLLAEFMANSVPELEETELEDFMAKLNEL